MVSYDTALELIEQLKIRLMAYVNANGREWSNCAVNIDKMEYQNAIHLTVAMEHRPNWQDWGGRWGRRTAFMRNLKTVLEDLDIRYTKPVQPLIVPRSLGQSSFLDVPPSPRSGPGGGPLRRGTTSSRETLGNAGLGNAGFFEAGELGRAPSRGFRQGVDRF